ncbi:MAG TPA: hypothetical protein VKB72_02800 [Steroidobacteraceae bacterium]|nr:hypothetical protein [Steroidobacteraceae bacterium]
MSSKSAEATGAARASAGQWVAERERGSPTLLRMMMFVSLHLGRPLARGILYIIAAYFFGFAPSARRHARVYLRRVLGREPTGADLFRQVFAFASTILDRFYLVRGRHELFDISMEGEELMRELLGRGEGAFLLGSHLGSFEMVSAVGRRQSGLSVAVAMYVHNRSRLAALFGPSGAEVIPLGQLDAMLRIRDCLEEGKFVGMLADRTLGDTPGQVVSFLGYPALFPAGPLRLAAALRRPVIFMTALYRGRNRYHVVFRQFADFSRPLSDGRETAVRAAVESYVALLEQYCRSDPYNWFNFYDFWHGAPAVRGSTHGGEP